MNGFSRIKLRRVPALLLFFLLGPALLLAVLGLVIYRHGGGSRADEEAKLSSLFRVRVEMRGAEFVRPEIQTYFGLTLFSGRAETPFLFCPEILARPLGADRPGPERIAPLLDELDAGESPLARPLDRAGGREWLIPDLYLKLSRWHDAEPFLYGRAGDFPKGGILFRIGRVHLIPTDDSFDRIVKDYRRPRRRFGADIIDELAAIGDGRTRGGADGTSADDEVVRYTQNRTESLVDEVLGIWLRADDDSFVLARFRLSGVTAPEPISLALFGRSGADSSSDPPKVVAVPEAVIPDEASEAGAEAVAAAPKAAAAGGFPLAWILDSRRSPFPAPLLAWFARKPADWGEESWLAGRLVSTVRADGAAPCRHTSLAGVEIHNADLSRLLKGIAPTRIEGRLERLTVKEGELSDDVFLGSGRIRLLDARFKKDFLIRFGKEFGLEFQPGNLLANRFDDDMVPLDRVAFDFTLGREGAAIKAAESSRPIVAVGESTVPPCRILLPPAEEKMIPYPVLLETLSDGSENSLWSSFYRDALNHLPVPEEKR